MTLEQANHRLKGQPKWVIPNMKRELEALPGLNTANDWRNLLACYTVLKTPHGDRISPINKIAF